MVFIDGIMNAAAYADILATNLTTSVHRIGRKKFIFQQDNDPKHTSKLSKVYFEKKDMKVLL